MAIDFIPFTDDDSPQRCSELLENHMQCGTHASFYLSYLANSTDSIHTTRAVCRFHAKLIKQNELMETKTNGPTN